MFPLASENGHDGYHWHYIKAPDVFAAMSPSDALAFVMVEQYLEPAFPSNTLSLLDSRFEQAHEVLKKKAHQLGDWSKKFKFLPLGLPMKKPSLSPEVVHCVHCTLLENKQLKIEYQKRGFDQPQIRLVNPLALVVRSVSYYLLATDERSQTVLVQRELESLLV